jgi:hypothetical protein
MERVARWNVNDYLRKGTLVRVRAVMGLNPQQPLDEKNLKVFVSHERDVTNFEWNGSYKVEVINNIDPGDLFFDIEEMQKLEIMVKSKKSWAPDEVEEELKKTLDEVKRKFRGAVAASKFGI